VVLFLISIRRGVFGTGVPLESFAVEVDLKDSLQTSLVNIVSATDLNSMEVYSGHQYSVGKLWCDSISELDNSLVDRYRPIFIQYRILHLNIS